MLYRFKDTIKKNIYARAGIPYSKSGISSLLLKYLERSQSINLVDVGAHNGNFTKALADYCGVAKGLLIEPIPQKAIQLRQSFCPLKYRVIECALSSKSGVTDFEVNEFQETSSILKIRREIPELASVKLSTYNAIKCQTRTLDDVVEEWDCNTIDLLKIDVQGAEHLVILGGHKTLQKTSLIWTEVSFKPLYENSSTFAEVYSLITQAGFKLFEVVPGFRAPDGELLQSDALFVKV